MKKCILSLISAALGCTTFAANCVSVKQINTDYTNHQITIAITRTGCTGDATNHRNTVWVFVDYRTVTGATKGAWTRAAISATSAGTVVNSGNSKGAWIYGANGTQTVTLTLSGMPAKYDWCAFATDYPPNVAAAGGVYTFKGTPPFVLQPATGSAQTVTQTTLATTALTVIPVSIRDATGCTGTFCPYSGSDLYIDATHVCQQRTGGAKNWEAWIKDSRDSKYYRIVLMPDNKWWLAQNMKLASYGGTSVGAAISGCTEDECGRNYSCEEVYAARGGSSGSAGNVQGICPNGWLLPVQADYRALTAAISSTQATVCACLRPLNSGYTPHNNCYGWASPVGIQNGFVATDWTGWYTNDRGREDGFIMGLDCNYGVSGNFYCATYEDSTYGNCGTNRPVVRCYRN